MGKRFAILLFLLLVKIVASASRTGFVRSAVGLISGQRKAMITRVYLFHRSYLTDAMQGPDKNGCFDVSFRFFPTLTMPGQSTIFYASLQLIHANAAGVPGITPQFIGKTIHRTRQTQNFSGTGWPGDLSCLLY